MGIYEFDREDAIRFGNEIGAKFRVKGDEMQFDRCPYCLGGHSGKDRGTFSINLTTGQFKCLRASCNAHGNMITLAKDFNFSLSTEVDEYYSPKKRFRNIHRTMLLKHGKIFKRMDAAVCPAAPCNAAGSTKKLRSGILKLRLDGISVWLHLKAAITGSEIRKTQQMLHP